MADCLADRADDRGLDHDEELVIGLSNAIRAVVTPELADKEHTVADKDKGDEVTGETTSALHPRRLPQRTRRATYGGSR